MSVVLFADFEAFQHGDEPFIMKELCILSATHPLRPLYFLFKPTSAWNSLTASQQRTYAFEESHIHGLRWSEGSTYYCKDFVMNIVEKTFLWTANDHVCYVMGQQKADYLRDELPQMNIIDFNYVSSYKELPPPASYLTCCYRQHSRHHCAMLKCYQLLSYYLSLLSN